MVAAHSVSGDLHGSKYKAVRKAMLKKGTAGAQQGAASSQGTWCMC